MKAAAAATLSPPIGANGSISGSQALFEEFVAIGSDLSDMTLRGEGASTPQRWDSSPRVLFRYGCRQHLTIDIAQIVSLVCPSGRVGVCLDDDDDDAARSRPAARDYVWSTQLTTPTNDLIRIFGICLTQSEPVTMIEPRSGQHIRLRAETRYCLTSRYPAFDVLLALIQALLAARGQPHPVWIAGPNLGRASWSDWDRSRARELLRRLERAGVPALGQADAWTLDSGLVVQVRRPQSDAEWIGAWAGRRALLTSQGATARSLLLLMEMTLREKSLVIVGEDPGLISAWALLLTSAIHPLQWAGICLPVLPDRWIDFLQSPVPIIAAVRYVPDWVQSQSGLVVWRPDCNEIVSDEIADLTEPARRSLAMIEPLMPLLPADPMAMDKILYLLSEYVSEIMERVRSDPDPVYDQYRQTQIWANYLYPNLNL